MELEEADEIVRLSANLSFRPQLTPLILSAARRLGRWRLRCRRPTATRNHHFKLSCASTSRPSRSTRATSCVVLLARRCLCLADPPSLAHLQKALASTADRDDLLSTSTPDHLALEMSDRSESPSDISQMQAQRSRLLSATDKLTDGQRRLEDSHRVALETEDLGAGILRDLRGQRDTLEHTRDSVNFLRLLCVS